MREFDWTRFERGINPLPSLRDDTEAGDTYDLETHTRPLDGYGYCHFCERVTFLMKGGLCLDCECGLLLLKIGRRQFLAELARIKKESFARIHPENIVKEKK